MTCYRNYRGDGMKEKYRPIVRVLKRKKGVPTKINLPGRIPIGRES